MTRDALVELRERVKHLRFPVTVDQYGLKLSCPSDKGGTRTLLDIRGWGYLTGEGYGALGLSKEEATAEQKATADFIAAAINSALIEQEPHHGTD